MVREILPDVKNIKQKIVIIVRNTYFNFDYRDNLILLKQKLIALDGK